MQLFVELTSTCDVSCSHTTCPSLYSTHHPSPPTYSITTQNLVVFCFWIRFEVNNKITTSTKCAMTIGFQLMYSTFSIARSFQSTRERWCQITLIYSQSCKVCKDMEENMSGNMDKINGTTLLGCWDLVPYGHSFGPQSWFVVRGANGFHGCGWATPSTSIIVYALHFCLCLWTFPTCPPTHICTCLHTHPTSFFASKINPIQCGFSVRGACGFYVCGWATTSTTHALCSFRSLPTQLGFILEVVEPLKA